MLNIILTAGLEEKQTKKTNNHRQKNVYQDIENKKIYKNSKK